MSRFILTAALVLAAALPGLAQKQPTPKSKAEVEAIQAMLSAKDPDARIKAADDLITKFADTEFKPFALFYTAVSYQQKNDYDKMVIYAERTLEADPKHYQAMTMMAEGLAQHTREHDLDKEEKLGRAEKLAKEAQELIKTAAKPNPQVTDDQWNAAKKDMTAQTFEALGLVAMSRKKYDEAATDFKTAIDTSSSPDPAAMLRLGAAYNLTNKPDEAIVVLEKIMNAPDVNPTIKQYAQAERARSVQIKNKASGSAPAAQQPPAQPAPAQVDVKK
jgi:tetratricopeptide (TPR) repeat protein